MAHTTATIPRNKDCGRLAAITPLASYEPNVSNNFDEKEVTPSIFQSSSVTSIHDLGDNSTASLDPQVDDGHIMNTLASLYLQERGAHASLSQAFHSNEESLLPGACTVDLSQHGETRCIVVTDKKTKPKVG